MSLLLARAAPMWRARHALRFAWRHMEVSLNRWTCRMPWWTCGHVRFARGESTSSTSPSCIDKIKCFWLTKRDRAQRTYFTSHDGKLLCEKLHVCPRRASAADTSYMLEVCRNSVVRSRACLAGDMGVVALKSGRKWGLVWGGCIGRR